MFSPVVSEKTLINIFLFLVIKARLYIPGKFYLEHIKEKLLKQMLKQLSQRERGSTRETSKP